jgi:hypothetical protein
VIILVRLIPRPSQGSQEILCGGQPSLAATEQNRHTFRSRAWQLQSGLLQGFFKSDCGHCEDWFVQHRGKRVIRKTLDSRQTLAEPTDLLVIDGCPVVPKSGDAIEWDSIGKLIRKQSAAG